MNQLYSFKHYLPITALLMITGILNGFVDDLTREYHKFEQLITQGTPTIYLKAREESGEFSIITRSVTPQKKWTFIIYMAADNDLRAFAANNIKQMASIGSNAYINIVVHMDIRLNGNQKITRRYFIEKNKLTHLNQEPTTQQMDSGDPQTLISCCKWAIQNFPADNYALIFWNHGTGYIDPKYYKIINPAELFNFNPRTNMLDLDRSTGFLDFLYFADLDQRGICWDNTTGNYLTNEKVEFALNEICANVLKKKFSLIGFDACLMSMLEVAFMMKKYGEVMVGSQEVELGTGWNYAYVLQPFETNSIDARQLAHHIVNSYKQTYHNITNDFTQSAIDLQQIEHIEKNVDAISKLLLEAIKHQNNNSVMQAIKASGNRKNCTHFDEPSYKDLHHFYCNLQERLKQCSIAPAYKHLLSEIRTKIDQGKQLIANIVFANIAGHNLKAAHGLSIYFPEQRMHPSYSKSTFAQSNAWYQLINSCK